MRKFISVVARFFAIVFAILFVLTTILAILLTTINRQMFNATIYKNAFSEQNIYERLPEIIGLAVKSTSSYISNPCSQNPLACSIDGASPELQTCLTTALGQAVYEAIGSGRRNPTDAELQLAQPCLDQYGKSQTSGSQSGPGDSGGGNGMPLYMKNLSAADWQAILTILLPPADLKTMTESTLDQLFAYLNGETDTVTIPLDKLKKRLTGTAGQDLILQLINSQPPCTMQNLEQMISGTNNSGLVLCKPPEFVLPFLVSLIQGLLNSATTGIPDKAVLIKPPAAGSPNPGSGPFGADPITTLRTVRLIMRLSPLVPLVFLLLVTLCAVRSVKSWLRWWGIPFFISGIITLGLEIFALPALNTALAIYIVPQIPPYIPTDIADIGQKLVRSIVHTLTNGIVLPAIILLALGLAVWIGTYFIKTKHEPDVPITQSTPTS